MRYNSPSSKLTKTSWPANVLLLVRHTIMPKIHGMPWPVSARSLIMERTLPHDDVLRAHTPSRLDMQISMAKREFIAMPLNEGLSSMQSSSGSSLFSLLFSGDSFCAFALCWLGLCWCLCDGLRAAPRASALLLFNGWFRDINSGLFSTLLRSLALDRVWFAGILIFYGPSSLNVFYCPVLHTERQWTVYHVHYQIMSCSVLSVATSIPVKLKIDVPAAWIHETHPHAAANLEKHMALS